MEAALEFSRGTLFTFQGGQSVIFSNIGPYILLAIVVAIEGPIATLFGAAAASAGLMKPYFVFLAAAGGNFIADLLWYTLGYMGKIEWVLRYGKWLGLKKHHIERIEDHMHNHAAKFLLLAKLSAGFMIPSLIAAGLAKVPIKRWAPALLVGETIWTGSLVLTGFYATEAIKQVAKGVHYIGIAGSIIFVLVIGFWIIRHFVQRSEEFRDVNIKDNTSKKDT
jgi:membrane protein DedA with SNARE-associated domain